MLAMVLPPLSLETTPSKPEAMVQEANLLGRVVEEDSDVCELDEARCVCRGEIADPDRAIPIMRTWCQCLLRIRHPADSTDDAIRQLSAPISRRPNGGTRSLAAEDSPLR